MFLYVFEYHSPGFDCIVKTLRFRVLKANCVLILVIKSAQERIDKIAPPQERKSV